MEAIIIGSITACLAWFGAGPLAAYGDKLLAQVGPTDAAPLEFDAGHATDTLVPALGRWWPLGLRSTLALALIPIALQSFSHPSLGHALWRVLALTICVAAFALTAILDGASHLIFGQILLVPVAVALIGAALAGPAALPLMVAGAAVAGGIVLVLFLLGHLLYGTDALGFGDVQLAAALGFVLGLPLAITALLWGCLALGAVAVLLLVTRRITLRAYMPLGTFCALGAILVICLRPLPWL